MIISSLVISILLKGSFWTRKNNNSYLNKELQIFNIMIFHKFVITTKESLLLMESFHYWKKSHESDFRIVCELGWYQISIKFGFEPGLNRFTLLSRFWWKMILFSKPKLYSGVVHVIQLTIHTRSKSILSKKMNIWS